ncbi:hypothetical protein [Carnobacterium pleistocenium]|uniref:hypothetical protein n=1 Tax=Carnobacterium pleistocenium TaxID=181073 RepID=UPI000A64B5CF|nr:hypothetical protein [Carnobacterium pleistocenium]
MYTNGQVIIEKNFFEIKLVTARTEIIYILDTEEKAYELFIKLILDTERNRDSLK